MDKVTFTVPKQDNDKNITDIDCLINLAITLAGGCTVSECKGYWRDKTGKLYIDENFKIEIATDNINGVIDHMLYTLLIICPQKSYYYEINGKPIFT